MSTLSLQKFLGLLVMPTGLLWILFILATLWCWRRKQRGPAILLTCASLLVTCLGNTFVGHALIQSLEADVPPVNIQQVEAFDAVFVLGSGSALDGLGNPMLSASGDRIAQAARMWHAGKARVLVASGTCYGADGTIRDCGNETRVLWKGMGIPESATLSITEPCWITRDEIAAYHRLQQIHGWKRVALVSSAYHLPRAMALAHKAGLEVIPVGADWRGISHPFALQYIVPTSGSLYDCQIACWEYLGHFIGR